MESTATQPSCISRPASTSAGESSWAVHFACFLQGSSAHGDQEMDRPAEGVSGSSFSSSFESLGGGGDNGDSFITSEMVMVHDDDDDDHQDDDSLQDTACSSAAAKRFVDASSRRQAIQGVISGENYNENQLCECNDLRKRGLCLVPLSMLIDYLG